uniref:AlNc14C249G9604 protein n=1 Tax=Albugo laibachii Nc14 TaxID=890382 RepID=F0WTC4_9STRA|nr:AlNc14C249G9604 [Albugo laibachii Nc14]|eukprot:CCA24614.1 AlNc14C249G9604 [Albugo laibachii Nc14]
MQPSCAPSFDEKHSDIALRSDSTAQRNMEIDLDNQIQRNKSFKDRRMAEYDANGHRITRTEASQKSALKSRKKRKRKALEKSRRSGYLNEKEQLNGNPKKLKIAGTPNGDSDSKSMVEKCASTTRKKRYEHISPRYLSHLEVKSETALERPEKVSKGPTLRSSLSETTTTTPIHSKILSNPCLELPAASTPFRTARITTPESETGVLDLESMSDTRRLETVEGRQILKTFLATSTPRFGRMLNTERRRPKYDAEARSLTYPSSSSSEDSDSEIPGQRRRQQRLDRKLLDRAEFLVSELDRPGMLQNEVNLDTCAPIDDNRLNATIIRWHSLKQSRGKSSLLFWLLFLCFAFVYRAECLSAISQFWVTSLPYCSDQVENQTLLDPTQDVNQYESFWTCRKCVLHGLCRNGVVEDCVSPYILQEGICVKSERDLDGIIVVATDLQEVFSDDQTASTLCMSRFPWPGQILSLLRSSIASSSVFLDDIVEQEDSRVDQLGTFDQSKDSSPRSRVISALDLIAARTPGVLIQTNESVILLARLVSTLSCSAKAVFVSYLFPVGVAAGLFFVVKALWNYIIRRKTERALTQYFCSRIRQTLRMRVDASKSKESTSADAYVLEDELRAELLGHIDLPHSSKEHLLDALWAKIVSHVQTDGQILCRNIEINGKVSQAWKWNE